MLEILIKIVKNSAMADLKATKAARRWTYLASISTILAFSIEFLRSFTSEDRPISI